MKIIISPAKKMNVSTDLFEYISKPQFLEKTTELLTYMKSLTYEQCKNIWKCNDKIAELNYTRIREMDLTKNLTPAVLSYEGLQYQYMAPTVMDEESFTYLKQHLRILSGFYGILRPFDGVVPYRLEMQSKMGGKHLDSLYEFWGDSPAQFLCSEDSLILNLASKEYSRCITGHLQDGVRLITCVFGEFMDGKIKEKGTMAKMARGEMVRFLAENRIRDIDGVKAFDRLGYRFSREHSGQDTLIFLKRKPKESER